jgi:PAS domain S-box-containing protein
MTSIAFLSGGGEMGQRMREHDWSTSPLGDPSGWPQSLRSVVGLMINSRYPMFCAWGPELAFLYNDGYIPVFGAKHPNTLGLSFKTVWAEIWDDVSPLIDHALSGGATYDENLHLVMERNGYPEDTWFDFSYSPLRDESGAIAGMFCACTEKTQAIIAERLLTEREAHYRAVFQQLSEGVITADETGKLNFVNQRAMDLHGIEDLTATPENYSDAYHLFRENGEPYPSSELPLARAALRGETVTDEHWLIRRPDGSEILAIGSACPILDEQGRQIGSVLTMRDDTQRSNAERALRESEARFRDLADNSPMMVWVTEADGQCVYLSRSWYEFTGQQPLQALGLGWLDAVHPDDRGWSGERFMTANERQEAFSLEYRVRRADGEYRWAIDAASPNIGANGEFLGFVGSVVDIHDRRERERVMMEEQKSLEHRVAEEVERRVQAEQALTQSQKLEALGQLTGGVAHDFNNLLTPIVGALDLAQKKLTDDPRTGRLVGGAIQAADRARTLVQRLLAFSRRQRLLPQAVDTSALVEGIADLLRRSLGPQIDLRLDIAAHLAPAHVDPNQLELALINLGINARDAMPEGGQLRIKTSGERVRHHESLADGHYVRIDVADSGTGMDQATLDRAMEPFFTTKDFGEGTGLGLSSVQGLALQSGGALALTSEPGRGTMASLWLPVSSDPIETVGKVDVGAPPRIPRDATILLVDDEALVRRGLADMITGLGYRVIEAKSATVALALVNQGAKFDAVVTDHAMPGMTGTELTHLLRERLPTVPVLIVTGYAHIAADSGPDVNILSKPFRENELATRLHALLAERDVASAK